MNRFQATAVLGLAALLFQTACTERARLGDHPAPDGNPVTARYGGTDIIALGGTAVVALGVDIVELNPLTATDANATGVQNFLLFVPLLARDAALNTVPHLARTWAISEDHTTLTFVI
jgi:ABC-type transport system substrate-binding protein